MSDKDIITIGERIDNWLELGKTERELDDIGLSFLKLTGHNEPHKLLKQITFFERGLDILEFAVDNIYMIRKTKTITVIDDDAKCVFIVYNNPDMMNMDESLTVQELSAYTKQFIFLSGVESKRTRAGEDLIVKITQRVGDRIPILLQAGCEYYGDYLTAQKETTEKNKKFYTRLGFRDVNNIIGNCGNSVAMLYSDDALYEKIMKSK